MKDYFWTTFFLLAVLQSAVAFRIPGLSGGGGGGGSGRSPSGGAKPSVAGGGGNAHKDGGEYMGPVFIIRELDKDKGEYDAFITTGGIQEVKPHPQQQQHQQQQQPPHPQQMVYQMNPAAVTPLPALAKDDVEDSEYFGVLITPDTVRTLNYPKSTNINVSLPVLLVAVSSRMPWLLVLHRKNYPAFEYQQQQQQQPLPTYGYQQPQQQPQQPQQQPPSGGIPGMQIPQRRRHYSPPLDRQRRGVYSYPDVRYDEARWSDGYKSENADDAEYDNTDDATKMRVVPLMLERQLMSTMCYNFELENADVIRPPVGESYFDADANAAGSDSKSQTTPKNWNYLKIKVKTRPYTAAQRAEVEKMNEMFLKRVSPQAAEETFTDEELDRMFPKRVSPQTTEHTYTNEELDRMFPKRVSTQTTKHTYTDEELDRMFTKRVSTQTTEHTYTDEELDRMFPKRVSPQTTEHTYTDEELDRMFTKRVSPQTAEETYTNEGLNRMVPRRDVSQPVVGTTFMEEIRNQLLTGIVTQATEEPAKEEKKTEEKSQDQPKHDSPDTTKETNTEEEPNRMLIRVEPHETMRPFTLEETKQANRVFSKRVESQPTVRPLTVEEAQAADKVFTGHDS